jgi:hypothetical protein
LWRDGFAVRWSAGDMQLGVLLGMGIAMTIVVRLAFVPAWGGVGLILAVYGGTVLLLRNKIGALTFLHKMAV